MTKIGLAAAMVKLSEMMENNGQGLVRHAAQLKAAATALAAGQLPEESLCIALGLAEEDLETLVGNAAFLLRNVTRLHGQTHPLEENGDPANVTQISREKPEGGTDG